MNKQFPPCPYCGKELDITEKEYETRKEKYVCKHCNKILIEQNNEEKEISQTIENYPDNIKKALVKHLEIFPEAKIIFSEIVQNTPYKDKSRVEITYKIYTLAGNYFTVLRSSDGVIYKNSMLAGEIIKIIENSPVWFRGVRPKE